jgi:hypothetical protein
MFPFLDVLIVALIVIALSGFRIAAATRDCVDRACIGSFP